MKKCLLKSIQNSLAKMIFQLFYFSAPRCVLVVSTRPTLCCLSESTSSTRVMRRGKWYIIICFLKISWNLILQALDFLKTSSEAASSSNLLGSIKKTVPLDPTTIQTSTPLPGRKMLLQANQVRKRRKNSMSNFV